MALFKHSTEDLGTGVSNASRLSHILTITREKSLLFVQRGRALLFYVLLGLVSQMLLIATFKNFLWDETRLNTFATSLRLGHPVWALTCWKRHVSLLLIIHISKKDRMMLSARARAKQTQRRSFKNTLIRELVANVFRRVSSQRKIFSLLMQLYASK